MSKYLQNIFLTMVIAAPLFLLGACKSSHLVCSWNYPSLNLTHYKKVLVIGLLGDKDDPLRQDLELDLASSLNAHGMKTYSAFEKYGVHSFQDKDANPALLEVKDTTYDAIVCIVLFDREKEKRHVAPSYRYNRYNRYNNYNNYNNFNGSYFNSYNGFQNYYNQSYGRIYSPGYYVNTSKYSIEVIVFDFPKDSILYYAETKTKNPKTLERMSTAITKEVTQDMIDKKILPALRK